jgi:hypothetical protein
VTDCGLPSILPGCRTCSGRQSGAIEARARRRDGGPEPAPIGCGHRRARGRLGRPVVRSGPWVQLAPGGDGLGRLGGRRRRVLAPLGLKRNKAGNRGGLPPRHQALTASPTMVVFAPWGVTSAFSAAGAPEGASATPTRQPARPVRPIRLWPARLPQPVLAFAEPLWPSPFPIIEGETSLCRGYGARTEDRSTVWPKKLKAIPCIVRSLRLPVCPGREKCSWSWPPTLLPLLPQRLASADRCANACREVFQGLVRRS